MAKTYVHTVTVQPDGYVLEFPLDMLRYDALYPDSQDDVGRLYDQVVKKHLTPDCAKRLKEDLTIVLIHVGDKNWNPTVERWKSFGWEVINHQKRER